jgi:chromosome segregation ATPase
LELEQENATLRAELDYQKESRELIQEKYSEEVEKLQKSLADYQAEQKIADSSICSLKKEQQSLIEAKSEFNRQITHLKAESRKRQSELSATIDSGQHEILLLRKKLESAIALKKDQAVLEATRKSLRHVEGENASLKQKIDNMRKMQLTLETQLRKNKQKRMQRTPGCPVRKSEQTKTWRSSDPALSLRRLKVVSTKVRGRPSKPRAHI